MWTLHTSKNIGLVESVQRRAARWIKSFFDPLTSQWTKSSSECIRELGWPSLELRCNYACIVMLYTILNNPTPIKFSEYYQLNKLSTRSHPLTIYSLQWLSIFLFCELSISLELSSIWRVVSSLDIFQT